MVLNMESARRPRDRPCRTAGRRTATALVALVLMTACAGQGSAESDAVTQAVEKFGTALAADDAQAACALLAPGTLEQLESSHGPCPTALPVVDLVSPGTVNHVDVYGKHAMVEASEDTVFLARFDEGWLVVAAGCVARPERPFDCAVEGS